MAELATEKSLRIGKSALVFSSCFAATLVVLVLCAALGYFGGTYETPPATASEPLDEAAFEAVGFGPLQSKLTAKVVRGEATEDDTRRIAILEQIRDRNYETHFATTTKWNDETITADWTFEPNGDSLEAVVTFDPSNIRPTDLASVAYKATSDLTPAVISTYQILDAAIETGSPQVEIIDGYVVSASQETESTIFFKVSAVSE